MSAQWAAMTAPGPSFASPYGTQARFIDDQPNPVQFRPRLGGSPNGHSHSHSHSHSSLAATTRARTPPQLYQQYEQHHSPLSPSKAPRVNPNSRCSAGFPLAQTAQQKAAAAERQLEQRLAWEAMHQAAAADAEAREQARLERELHSGSVEAAGASAGSGSGSGASAKQIQLALYQRQMRDCKIPFRERMVPPKPDHPEDPLTAHAAEHTGRYPGPLIRSPPPRTPLVRDQEPAAAEGSAERVEQKRRTNPLLDPLYRFKSDAAGLGYGRTHRNHFRYISHWTTGDSVRSSSGGDSNGASLHGYRSKDGRGYQPEARALGWGAPHGPTYNSYVSVRRAEDVLKDYPSREACEKFFNSAPRP